MSTPDQRSIDDIALNAARIAVKEFATSDAMREAMSTAIQSALEKVGMNISTPEAREKLRRDMDGLRTWTEFWDFARKKGIGTTINWLITGALAALASGLWLMFHK